MIFGDALNAQDPLADRAWKKAIFNFPNGIAFSLLPGAGESNSGGGAQIEPRVTGIFSHPVNR